MLKTAKQYIESLQELKLNLYLLGEKVEDWVNNPIIRPSTNAVAMTYKRRDYGWTLSGCR